jgi:hypothetical protein
VVTSLFCRQSFQVRPTTLYMFSVYLSIYHNNKQNWRGTLPTQNNWWTIHDGSLSPNQDHIPSIIILRRWSGSSIKTSLSSSPFSSVRPFWDIPVDIGPRTPWYTPSDPTMYTHVECNPPDSSFPVISVPMFDTILILFLGEIELWKLNGSIFVPSDSWPVVISEKNLGRRGSRSRDKPALLQTSKIAL